MTKGRLVGIVMGSISDLKVMSEASSLLEEFGIPYEINVISAHRTPQKAFDYAKRASSRGLRVIIAGAGGAAHLPGVLAALTTLPIIGVPIRSSHSVKGLDSILSIVQMPTGVPVASVGLNAAKNAGILAAQILALNDEKLSKKLKSFKDSLKENVEKSAKELKAKIELMRN